MEVDRKVLTMPACLLAAAIAIGLANPLFPLGAQSDAAPESSSASEQIARGRYLVHDVAQCVVCHTPRDEQGDLDETRLLRGAVIPVRGPEKSPPWAFRSASIAGLNTFSQDDVVHLLRTGERPDGTKPKWPMPRFHMNREDAEAVVAYLGSI